MVSQLEREISKSIVVRRNIEAAFQIWTEQITTWWPKSHSISGNLKTTVILEGKPGGRFYERTPDGLEYDWGEVTLWEPPHRLVYNWYLGSSPRQPTQVEVHFTAEEQGITRVDVKHYGPELVGELWWARSANYNSAWENVLPYFVAACNPQKT